MQTSGYPGQKNFMQVAFFCCSRQGAAGMSRDLGRDVPDLEKLYARKLWADFLYPTRGQAMFGFRFLQGGLGSVRLRFGDGTVRAVAVFGSEEGLLRVSVQFHREDGSGSGFSSWKTVPAVLVPHSVPAKTVPTVPVSGSGSVPGLPFGRCAQLQRF